MAGELKVSEEAISQLQTAQGHAERVHESTQAFHSAIMALRAAGHSGDWLTGLENWANTWKTAGEDNFEAALTQLKTHIQGLSEILDAQKRLGAFSQQDAHLG